MTSVLAYFAAIVAANLSVAAFGPWSTPVNAFLLIGLDLTLRDHLHERWRGRQLAPKMLALIAGAGLVSYLLNPAAGQVAVASLVAFSVAAVVDAVIYQGLIRKGYFVRTNGSNAAGALVDSLLFPTIAFGGFLPHIVALQFLFKVAGGAAWAVFLRKAAR